MPVSDPIANPAADALPSQPYRSALVSGRKTLRFAFAPDEAARAMMAQALGLLDLPEFGFKGEMSPMGRADVVLRAELTGLVVQPCSITLAPVRSRIKDQVERHYRAEYIEPTADEVEIPEDDADPLPEIIDVAAVALEALALALPLYPRAKGAELGEANFAAPGVAPLKSDDLKPFAGLAGLAAQLKKAEDPAS
jgi:uncharacterized metal-binding protein YceD (DUF177 family)